MAKPDYVPKLLQRAVAEHNRGNPAEAGRLCERVLKQDRRNFDANHLLGVIRRKQGDAVGALRQLEAAAEQVPQRTAVAGLFWLNHGLTLAAVGRYKEAIASYDRATNVTGQHAWALAYNRGNALVQINRYTEAIASYRRALEINPNQADAHFQLGRSLFLTGEREAAIASLDRSIALDSQLDAQLLRCMAELPILYDDEAEIAVRRAAYTSKLEQLAANATGELYGLSATPFFLAYQGQDDRELQQRFGVMLCRLVAKHNPPIEKIASVAKPREPIRVGIVSRHFYQHTIWKIMIRGWLSQVDRRRFRVSCYMTSGTVDAETDRARAICERFVAGPRSIAAWRDEIVSDRPHVLLYPEVGMDPATEHLAAMRLAPVQCVSWGHPVTTGLPTMDYFLTSECMEPPGGEEHYTEKLVRLPNLSVYYEPIDTPPASMTREEIGLRPGACVYWCGQSLFKYLPQYDQAFARIAREAAGCQFVFIDLSNSQRAKFRLRLERVFAAEGLRAEHHCVILDRLSAGQFSAVLSLSDVYLDSISWSGFNTTMESLEHNLPIVTMRTSFMRGRHTLAIVQQMGLPEAVAGTLDEYVALAVRFAKNPEERAAMRMKIGERKERLYRDISAIRALEDFIERVARAQDVARGDGADTHHGKRLAQHLVA
jgi:predicted O-linked N-acetylglucosamine transferase (SPINDLY family)